jgi:hypothetical protein
LRLHDLKAWPDHHGAIADGRKVADVRINDRKYAVGDFINFRCWSPEGGYDEAIKDVFCRITHITTPVMLRAIRPTVTILHSDYVVLSITRVQVIPKSD